MHIILSNLVWRGGELQAAIARHIPAGVAWSDSIAGNGKTAASIIPGALPENVIAAMARDRDVLDYLYLVDESEVLAGEPLAKVNRSALRHGIPMDAMPATPTGADVAEAVKRRMLLSQVIADGDMETADRLERKTIERMKDAGFNVTEVNPGDPPATRIAKAQKRQNPGG